MALGLAVAAMAGVIALGAAEDAARGGDPQIGVGVEVTVWRALGATGDLYGDLYVGAREAGGLWRRHPAALDLSATSASGRFRRSGTVRLTAPLTGGGEAAVEAVVWRSVADPARLHLSVRPEGGRWRTVNEPLAMRTYEPYYSWNRYQRADAVVVGVPRPDPPPVAMATGPLIVFTADSDTVAWRDEDGWRQAEDTYVLDTATDRYWRASTRWPAWGSEPGGVRLAGSSLIVWDERQVRRVGLDGREEAVLYEGEGIYDLSVSPDGAKVAILDASNCAPCETLIVLDATSGAFLLRPLYSGQQSFSAVPALLPDARNRNYSLAGWNAASDAVALTANGRTHLSGGLATEETQTAIFALDGAFQVLPPNAGYLSPDFRYAIQPHDGGNGNFHLARYQAWFWHWGWVWSGFDVIETASGRVVRTVTATDDTFTMPHGPSFQREWQWPGWWPGSDRFSWFEMGRHVPGVCGYDFREQPAAEGSVTATECVAPLEIVLSDIAWWKGNIRLAHSAVGARILDIASGEIGQPTPDEWYGLRMEEARLTAQGYCNGYTGQACGFLLEGRPVWNGAGEIVGVVDPDGPFTLRGVRLRDPPRPPDLPNPPARAEMTGPLFAWSVADGYERAMDMAGNERFRPVRRVVVRDEGTGRSWRAFNYRLVGSQLWSAHGGFVLRSGRTVQHLTPDGQSRTLLVEGGDIRGIHVSPSGRRVLVSLRDAGTIDVTLALFALPSGDELLRIDSSEPRFDDALRDLKNFSSSSETFIPLGWSADETAITVALGHKWSPPEMVLGFDGGFAILPDNARESALSPDFRYVAVGKDRSDQSRWWGAIDVVEVASGRVARTVPVRELSGDAVGPSGWGWTADGRFAWSPANGFDFEHGRIGEGGDGEVWLLDVETGATERLSARAWAARRAPAAGAGPRSPDFGVSCPGGADLIQWCSVLLDGETVGEGRWAEAIGFVTLD